MRLKPDEAAAVLQEDGGEARVGGVSIQIMANISQQQQPQQQQQQQQHTSPPQGGGNTNTFAIGPKGGAQRSRLGPAGAGFRRGGLGVGTSPPPKNLTCGGDDDTGTPTVASEAAEVPEAVDTSAASARFGHGGRPGAGLKRRVFKPLMSRPATAAAASPPQPRCDFANGSDLAPPSPPPETAGEGTPASGGSCFPSARQTAAAAAIATVAATVATAGSSVANGNRVGLGGAGRGKGGARRFHAPRLSREAAPSGANPGPRPASATRLVAARDQRGAGKLGSGGGGAPGGRASAGGGSGGGGTDGGGGGRGASRVGLDSLALRASPACRRAEAAVNREDLVLEWNGDNPPRPLLAGASLARRLHPHQREGLKVLWECLAGRGG